MKSRDVVFIDLETTGLSAESDEVTEIALVRLRHKEGSLDFEEEPIAVYESKVIPERAFREAGGLICPFLASLNKYDRNSWEAEAEPLYAVLQEIHPMLEGASWVGRNPNFDYSFLEVAYKRFRWNFPKLATRNLIDVGSMLFPLALQDKVYSVSQKPLMGYYKLGEQEHTAMSDVVNLIKLYQNALASWKEKKVSKYWTDSPSFQEILEALASSGEDV